MNIDLLPPAPVEELDAISKDLIDLITRFCGGHCRVETLSAKHPKISLASLP
jgi:hypothetical protein